MDRAGEELAERCTRDEQRHGHTRSEQFVAQFGDRDAQVAQCARATKKQCHVVGGDPLPQREAEAEHHRRPELDGEHARGGAQVAPAELGEVGGREHDGANADAA